MFLELSLKLLYTFNFNFLSFKLLFGSFKLLMFVTEFVNLSLEFVGLLLFNSLNVALCNTFDLGQAAVGEAVASEFNLFKSCVLV